MTDTFNQIIAYIIGVCCAPLMSAAVCAILNKAPARWFCDYDEEPTPEMLGVRFKYKKNGILLSVIFAAGYSASFAIYSFTFYTILVDIVFTVLMSICVSDVKYTIIPDELTIALAIISACGAVYDILNSGIFCDHWYTPLLGCASGAGLILLINLFSFLVFKKEGIGFGDLKLFAAIGLLSGFPGIFVLIYLSVLVAFCHFAPLIITKKLKKDAYYPMGPYICIAAALFLLFKEQISHIIGMYINIF